MLKKKLFNSFLLNLVFGVFPNKFLTEKTLTFHYLSKAWWISVDSFDKTAIRKESFLTFIAKDLRREISSTCVDVLSC